MTHVSLRKWSNQFTPPVIAKIRRVIAYFVDQGECVVVLSDGTAGLTDEVMAELQRDWEEGKVLFSKVHPELGGPTPKRARRRRHL